MSYVSTILATPGIHNYYRLNETTGTVMTDSGPAASNGAYVPSRSPTAAGALANSGDNDAAIHFSISTWGQFQRQIQDDFTIEFWFNTDGGHTFGDGWFDALGLIGADVIGVSNDFGISIDGNGSVRAGIGNPDTTIISSNSGYNDQNWHYCALTRSRTTGVFTLYLDAVQQAQGTGNKNALIGPANIAISTIGLTEPDRSNKALGAVFDEVATYTVELDPDTIREHYNAAFLFEGSTLPSQPPVSLTLGEPGYWSMVLTDYGGHSLGELNNVYNRQFTFALNNQCSGSFQIRDDHPLIVPVLSANCRVKVYDPTGTLRLHGPIVSVELAGADVLSTANVVFADPLWVLQRRLIGKSVQGYSDGTVAVPKDRGLIAQGIIDAVNADGDSGVRVGAISSSATTTIGPLRYAPAAEALLNLSAPLDGFDFQIVPSEPIGDAMGLQIGTFTCGPALGTGRPQIIFEYAMGAANVASFDTPITLDGMANSWFSLPQNFPSNAVQNVVNVTDPGSVTQWGLLEGIVQSDIVADDLRTELITEYLRIRKQPRQVVAFQPAMDAPRALIDYGLGDTIRFRAACAGYTFIDALLRVFAVDIAIDDNGTATDTPHLINDSQTQTGV